MTKGNSQYGRLLAVRELYDEKAAQNGIPGPKVVRDLLIEAVQEFTGYSIEVISVNWSSNLIKSRLERNDAEKTAQIVISADLNLCWKSFATAKELAHLIFDEPGTSCVSTSDEAIGMIEAMLSEAAFGSAPISIQGAVVSEWIMLLGAAELLFPYPLAIVYAEKAKNNELTDFHIANIFKIPTAYVERMTAKSFLEAWGAIRDSA